MVLDGLHVSETCSKCTYTNYMLAYTSSVTFAPCKLVDQGMISQILPNSIQLLARNHSNHAKTNSCTIAANCMNGYRCLFPNPFLFPDQVPEEKASSVSTACSGNTRYHLVSDTVQSKLDTNQTCPAKKLSMENFLRGLSGKRSKHHNIRKLINTVKLSP